MTQVLVTRAAFNVTTQNNHILRVARAETVGAADHANLLVGQERVVTGDRHVQAERARGRDLSVALVVHEHQFGVGLYVFVDLVATKGTGCVTLVGALVVVQRAVVVHLAGLYQFVADNTVGIGGANNKGTCGAGAGTETAAGIVVQGAGAVIARAL